MQSNEQVECVFACIRALPFPSAGLLPCLPQLTRPIYSVFVLSVHRREWCRACAQLGQFQARQGALASGLTNGVLAGNAAAAAAAANNVVRRDALAAGIINHQGALPTDLRAMRAPGGAVDRGAVAAAAAAAAASGAPHANLHSPVVSQPGLQGYSQSSLAAALSGQQAAMNYPGATSRLNGSSMQQLQNTGRLGTGLGGNAAVNQLLHQGLPGTSAPPPTSVAPSQDLLSMFSRQKQV